MAETGDEPKEMVQGILCALQKPGKPKGPPQNLRPIILLSIIRKILAICLIERIGMKLDDNIPPSQAAYRKGRSTTEHVFAAKLVVDRTITSKSERVDIVMHDMSKAFDSIDRKSLITDLQMVLQPDELHLVYKLIQVELAVTVGNHTTTFFKTDTGAPQGDCMSANEFTFYLAKTLETRHEDHNYCKSTNAVPYHLQEHNYTTVRPDKRHININLEYADDISMIT